MVVHRFRLGVPFSGCDGPGEATKQTNWLVKKCIEVNQNLSSFLSAAHDAGIRAVNVLNVDAEQVENCDVLVMGPM